MSKQGMDKTLLIIGLASLLGSVIASGVAFNVVHKNYTKKAAGQSNGTISPISGKDADNLDRASMAALILSIVGLVLAGYGARDEFMSVGRSGYQGLRGLLGQ